MRVCDYFVQVACELLIKTPWSCRIEQRWIQFRQRAMKSLLNECSTLRNGLQHAEGVAHILGLIPGESPVSYRRYYRELL